jgi:predicted house-cleaning noncanonical NTP pyrophosphatase (MazG superfamily)
MNNSEALEFLDNNNGEKSQYMELILKVLHDNGTSKEDTDLIQNAIYSYNTAK